MPTTNAKEMTTTEACQYVYKQLEKCCDYANEHAYNRDALIEAQLWIDALLESVIRCRDLVDDTKPFDFDTWNVDGIGDYIAFEWLRLDVVQFGEQLAYHIENLSRCPED
jgi:hypothetical protein